MRFQIPGPAMLTTRQNLGQGVIRIFEHASVPVLVTAFLFVTGTGRATLFQSFLAYLPLQFGWAYWVHWKTKPLQERDFPLFTVIASMYWLAFGLPLFWSLEGAWQFRGTRPVSSDTITRSLILSVVALTSLFVGMQLRLFRWLRRVSTLDLRDQPFSPKYVGAVLLGGIAITHTWLAYRVGSGFRQIFMIMGATVPMAAFAILLRRRLLRPVPRFETAVLIVFIAATVGFGLSSGWVGTGTALIIVSGCVLVDARSKIPKVALALAIAYVLFLQPTKEEFRARYWSGATESSQADRAQDWISMSLRRWREIYSASDPGAVRNSMYSSLARLSLLQQTANVMEITPNVVPYQGSFMYKYMAVTLIPRAVWPDKPSVNEANRFYQLTYGLTADRDLDSVSVSVGMATESYIAFGWAGTVCIMMLVGVFLDAIQTFCLARSSGVLMRGLGMALMPGLADIESQMAQYFGGIAQRALVTIAVMLPIVEVRRRGGLMAGRLRHIIRPPAAGQRIGRAAGPAQVR